MENKKIQSKINLCPPRSRASMDVMEDLSGAGVRVFVRDKYTVLVFGEDTGCMLFQFENEDYYKNWLKDAIEPKEFYKIYFLKYNESTDKIDLVSLK
jgi:hypothetical protein